MLSVTVTSAIVAVHSVSLVICSCRLYSYTIRPTVCVFGDIYLKSELSPKIFKFKHLGSACAKLGFHKIVYLLILKLLNKIYHYSIKSAVVNMHACTLNNQLKYKGQKV